MTKRCFDLLAVLMILPVAIPVGIVVAALVALKLGTPVFFTQMRVGCGGRTFQLYKFRSMTNHVGTDGKLLADDQRLTTYGQRLRSLSLDELPQLWNVLRGDLSLVGPRPLLTDYLPLYSPRQQRRHEVLPGITGWAQVNGRNALTWAERFELDVWYVDHWSVWLDLKIIWLTLFTVLRRDGIDSRSGKIMEPFDGTN